MPKQQLIKVHYNGPEMMEHLWAKPMNDNTAKIMNIPFQEGLNLHDLVQLNEGLNIIGIIKRKTETFCIQYAYGEKTLQEDWKKLVKHLEKNNVRAEGVRAGYASLAVPLNMKRKRLEGIINKSPVKILEFGSRWFSK